MLLARYQANRERVMQVTFRLQGSSPVVSDDEWNKALVRARDWAQEWAGARRTTFFDVQPVAHQPLTCKVTPAANANPRSGLRPSVQLPSRDLSWPTGVIRADSYTFAETGDTGAAWTAVLRTASETTPAINICVPNPYRCTGMINCGGNHLCSTHGHSQRCHGLKRVVDQTNRTFWQLCPQCYNKPADAILRNYLTKRLSSSVQRERSIAKEYHGLESTTGLSTQTDALIITILRVEQLPPMAYRDVYRGVVVNWSPCVRNPSNPSVDAIFPFAIRSGRKTVHGPGNLDITAIAINSCKHIYLPIFMDGLARYVRAVKAGCQRLPTGHSIPQHRLNTLQTQLITDCAQWTAVRLRARVNKEFSNWFHLQ
jgi:hypothetical protein